MHIDPPNGVIVATTKAVASVTWLVADVIDNIYISSLLLMLVVPNFKFYTEFSIFKVWFQGG